MKIAGATFSRSSLFGVLGGGVVLLAAGWWTWYAHGLAGRAEHALRSRLTEQRALVASDPAPTASVAEALTAAVARAEKAVAKGRDLLGAAGPDPVQTAPVPPQRSDAFFQLAQFVESQQATARKAGVALPPGAQFSFSAYSNSGPDDAHLALVHRQQLVVARLLDALWKVHPRELTRVQREVPASKLLPGDEASGANRRGGRSDDLFELPAGRSAARPGIVDTLAFRVGFIGRTGTLRRYLTALAALDVPLVVREVTVEPLSGDGRTTGGVRSLADLFRDEDAAEDTDGTATSDSVPIIAANEAEFLVTVEYLDFASPVERRALAEDEEVPR